MEPGDACMTFCIGDGATWKAEKKARLPRLSIVRASRPVRRRAILSVSMQARRSKGEGSARHGFERAPERRPLMTDMLGRMMRVEGHSAGIQDRDGATFLFDRITARFPFIERFFADAAYQGPRVAATAPRPVEIVKRSEAGFVVQAKQWIVERTVAWITSNRRLVKLFGRFAETVQTLSQVSMIKLMSRTIAPYQTFQNKL